MLKTPETIN